MAVHPSKNKLFVAAGAKWGSVGMWDVNDQTSDTHGVHLIKVSITIIDLKKFEESFRK